MLGVIIVIVGFVNVAGEDADESITIDVLTSASMPQSTQPLRQVIQDENGKYGLSTGKRLRRASVCTET